MRHHRRGATIVSTMIILTGLMVVASTTALLLNAESRSTGYTAMARRSLYCAEAGLVTARANSSRPLEVAGMEIGGSLASTERKPRGEASPGL